MLRKTEGNDEILLFVRLSGELIPWIPLLDVGIDLLLSNWRFPDAPAENVKKRRIWTNTEVLRNIEYLTEKTGKSKQTIVGAALVRARQSNLRPPSLGREFQPESEVCR